MCTIVASVTNAETWGVAAAVVSVSFALDINKIMANLVKCGSKLYINLLSLDRVLQYEKVPNEVGCLFVPVSPFLRLSMSIYLPFICLEIRL